MMDDPKRPRPEMIRGDNDKPRFEASGSMGDGKPILNFQLYDPPRPKKAPPAVNPQAFVPLMTPNPYSFPQMSGYTPAPPYGMVPNQVPMIKNYSINVSGPQVDHAIVSKVYEDVLPEKDYINSSNTLGERLNMLNFLRSVIIKRHDGEEISLNGKSSNSLLSYLKFLEVNPYRNDAFSDNPYKSLPYGLLIYRSCYPIRHDPANGTVTCAKNAIGVNIRIYRMSIGELNIRRVEESEYYRYNVWREIAYYEYIREQILKKKVCPNFAAMYGYFICNDCKIDFDSVARAQGKMPVKDLNVKELQEKVAADVAVYNALKKTEDFIRGDKGDGKKPMPPLNEPGEAVGDEIQDGGDPFKTAELKRRREQLGVNGMNLMMAGKDDDQKTVMNLQSYSGSALVALTEAPNYNLYNWASKTYEAEGVIRRMVNTGFHDETTWFSVLFQLMAAMYTMQIHKIAFRDFSIKDNVYIKDLQVFGKSTQYWKYRINGVEYYIPNCGYLVLIDSNFKDIKEKEGYTLRKSTSSAIKYKLYSNIYTQDGGDYIKPGDLRRLCFKAFRKCLSPNSFSESFRSMGGIKPPEKVLNLLSNMMKDGESSDIGDFIYRHMRMFMNNRIGTLLKDTETGNVLAASTDKFKTGQLVAYEVSHSSYVWGMFAKDNGGGMCRILTKESYDSDVFVEKDVQHAQLKHYSKFASIEQNYKGDKSNLNESNLLETYTLTK